MIYCSKVSLFVIVISRFEACFSGHLNALKCEGFIGEYDIVNDIKFLYFILFICP